MLESFARKENINCGLFFVEIFVFVIKVDRRLASQHDSRLNRGRCKTSPTLQWSTPIPLKINM